MKNRKTFSYYMGASYRGTKRPSMAIKKNDEKESDNNAGGNLSEGLFSKSFAIHSQKNKVDYEAEVDKNFTIPFKDHQEKHCEGKKRI